MTYSGSLGDLSIPGESGFGQNIAGGERDLTGSLQQTQQQTPQCLPTNSVFDNDHYAMPAAPAATSTAANQLNIHPGTLSLDPSVSLDPFGSPADVAPMLTVASNVGGDCLSAGAGVGGVGFGLGLGLGGASYSDINPKSSNPNLNIHTSSNTTVADTLGSGFDAASMAMPPPPGRYSGGGSSLSGSPATGPAGSAGPAGSPSSPIGARAPSDKHGLESKEALSKLHAIVAKFSPVEDNSTFQYHIRIQYRNRIWEVLKRFSEFDVLLNQLDEKKIANLPPLPPLKTLFGRPLDTESAEQRKRGLQQLLHDLLIRPDIRCSSVLRQFLALDSNYLAAEQAYLRGEEGISGAGVLGTSSSSLAENEVLPDALHNGQKIPVAPRKFLPEVLRTFEDTIRFAVAAILPVPEFNIIITLNQDASSLSRLGKVWSVIEADELANVHVWSFDSASAAWVRKQSLGLPHKASKLAWDASLEKLFIGCGDGSVYSYTLDKMNRFAFITGSIIALHGNAAITDMAQADSPTLNDPFGRRVLTVAFDNTMRIFDADTHNVVCGGRVGKRLPEGVYATSCYLDGEHKRAFVGTCGFDVLVFDVSSSPPKFLYHHQFASFAKPQAVGAILDTNLDFPTIVDGSHVSGIQRAKDVLCIGHSNQVAVFPLLPSGQEAKMFGRGIGELKGPTDAIISTVSIASDRECVVAGFLDGVICIWRYDYDKPILAVQGHLGTVSTIRWLDSLHPWGPALLSGGFDSRAHTWDFDVDVMEYEFWHPSKKVRGADDLAGPKIIGKSNFTGLKIAQQVDEDENRPIRFGDSSNAGGLYGNPNALNDTNPLSSSSSPVGGSALLTATGTNTGRSPGIGRASPSPETVGATPTTMMGHQAQEQQQSSAPGVLINRGTLRRPGEPDSDDDDLVGVF